MPDQPPYEDELARRRAVRRQARESSQEMPGGDEELPQMGWSDVFAMVIAAYQVLLPVVLGLIGAILVTYLLFRFYFS